METVKSPLGITDVVLRDGHQSLLATRLRLEDMLPIAPAMDEIGYWSIESWGGATFDACIRYLGEDPWERIRALKKAMPNTPQQMLLRGQNILGYRHYADDVVEKFVERAAQNGVDVFRVFDAMNDMRNIRVALESVKKVGKHAQGTLSYTISPVHTIDTWVDLGRQIEDLGAHSIAIKDMAGLLKPYDGYDLVSRLKEACDIPIHMQCHATTGLSTATILKCVEAGIDNVDTSISSMSMTYGHSPTETVVSILKDSDRDPGLDIVKLEEIASYFRSVRKRYAQFEGSLRGVDSRILVAQVPGGMLTNMENQLREQGAEDRLDEVLEEIPRVREDLGYIPLVTPTSQIVGSQAVLNVLTNERYKSITRETAGVLKGEYGTTPAKMNLDLQARVLEGNEVIRCRPADLLSPELASLHEEVSELLEDHQCSLCEGERQMDDVLTYALFPQVGLKFLLNRGNSEYFEPPPQSNPPSSLMTDKSDESGVYTVVVNGESFVVHVAEGAEALSKLEVARLENSIAPSSSGEKVTAGLAGNIVRILVNVGEKAERGQVLLILEAMKMETEVVAPCAGTITDVYISAGDAVAVGDNLISLKTI